MGWQEPLKRHGANSLKFMNVSFCINGYKDHLCYLRLLSLYFGSVRLSHVVLGVDLELRCDCAFSKVNYAGNRLNSAVKKTESVVKCVSFI